MADTASVRTGILLVNLGTPDDSSPAGVRQFLKEMLSDRRIVELPRISDLEATMAVIWDAYAHGRQEETGVHTQHR